jgi:hypothetical protein
MILPCDPSGWLSEVGFADDMIPIKDTARLVAEDHHGDALGNPNSDHISDSGSPQIMEQLPFETYHPEGLCPGVRNP